MEIIADVLNGFAFDSGKFSNDSGFPLIRIRDLGQGKTECNYTGEFDPRFLVKTGDLLIGMDGDFNSSVWRGPDALLNQRVCKIVLRGQEYSQDFLVYVLPAYLKEINKNTSSLTVKHLSSQSVKEIPLPLPPIQEQLRIVKRIDELFTQLDAGVAALKKVQAQLRRYRQAVLAAAYDGRLTARRKDPDNQGIGDRQPPHWSWKRCEELCEPDRTITYGVIKLGHDEEEGIPTLRSSNVRHLRIDKHNVKKITKQIESEYKRTSLKGGEVLVTVRGTLGGVAAVPPEMQGFNISREVAMIPVSNSIVDSQYLAFAIGSPKSQQWLKKTVKGIAYSGINLMDLRKLPILLPPLSEQHEIVNQIERLLSIADEGEKNIIISLRQAESLRQSILKIAFEGKLVPQDPNDEPASVLLKRIKAEKAKQKPEPKRGLKVMTTTQGRLFTDGE